MLICEMLLVALFQQRSMLRSSARMRYHSRQGRRRLVSYYESQTAEDMMSYWSHAPVQLASGASWSGILGTIDRVASLPDRARPIIIE
jgi:hypothetical protein